MGMGAGGARPRRASEVGIALDERKKGSPPTKHRGSRHGRARHEPERTARSTGRRSYMYRTLEVARTEVGDRCTVGAEFITITITITMQCAAAHTRPGRHRPYRYTFGVPLAPAASRSVPETIPETSLGHVATTRSFHLWCVPRSNLYCRAACGFPGEAASHRRRMRSSSSSTPTSPGPAARVLGIHAGRHGRTRRPWCGV